MESQSNVKYSHPFDDDGHNKECFVFTPFHDHFISFVEFISTVWAMTFECLILCLINYIEIAFEGHKGSVAGAALGLRKGVEKWHSGALSVSSVGSVVRPGKVPNPNMYCQQWMLIFVGNENGRWTFTTTTTAITTSYDAADLIIYKDNYYYGETLEFT